MPSETFHIPEEVTMEILRCLPVKSLIRFTSVSKRWHSIILSDPKFAASQFKSARRRKKTLAGHRLVFSDALQLELLDLERDSSSRRPTFGTTKIAFPFDRKLVKTYNVTLLGSCNGILFLRLESVRTFFYVWNPLTGFSMQLPELDVFFGIAFYGAGYVSATDDYKLFLGFYIDIKPRLNDCMMMKMFSSRDHAWKTIENPSTEGALRACARGVLVNEALHWVISTEEISVFDLALEEIRTMPLPFYVPQPNNSSLIEHPYLGVCEGCLCVCLQAGEGVSGYVTFWVMRKYGVYESWANYFYVPVDRLDVYLRFLVTERCTIGVKERRSPNGNRWVDVFVKLDRGKEIVVGTREHQNYWFHRKAGMIEHEESLLWINDDRSVVVQ